MTTRYRTKEEIQAFNATKSQLSRARIQDIAMRKSELLFKREFKKNNIVIDKYVTYSNQRINLNKKSFIRLMEAGKAKWGL